MAERRPAFYAAAPGGWRDWWSLLHPPYTVWHLSYVAIGAALAPHLDVARLGATLLAFLAAVGISAHAIDEVSSRPLGTAISRPVLMAAAAGGLVMALGLGVAGVVEVGWVLIPFMVIGPVLVLAYNAELFGGVVHTDAGFAAAWGAFPVLTAYVAQAGRLGWAAIAGAVGAFGLSFAQRSLSTPARMLRRRTVEVEGSLALSDGTSLQIDHALLLDPLERALRALSWAMVFLAAAVVLSRW
ncbi:MAG: hypothetical protein ACYCTI_00900 [Acidimicrobiales bacterium]